MPVIIKKEGDPLDPKHPFASGALIVFGGKRPAILPRPSTAKSAEEQAPGQETMAADKAKPEEKA